MSSSELSKLPSDDSSTQTIQRLPIIDWARGFALFTMAIYHFCWDLEWYSLVSWPVAASIGWRFFAGSIAVTFLFFTGVSLMLAHANGIRWKPYFQRLAMVVAGAAVVTASTWYIQPASFVWFGILHCIAAAGLIGLVFLRLPPIFTLTCAIVIMVLPFVYKTPLFNAPYLTWIGLSTSYRYTVDYVPIFPWLGPPLVGIALMKFGLAWNFNKYLATFNMSGRFNELIRFTGRHGLLFYLVHQPIMVGIISAMLFLGVGTDIQSSVRFYKSCAYSCANTNRESSHCSSTCSCLVDRLKTEDDWREVFGKPNDSNNLPRVRETYRFCEQTNNPQ